MALILKLSAYVLKKEGSKENIIKIWHNCILLKFNDLSIKFFSKFNQIQQKIFEVSQSNAIAATEDHFRWEFPDWQIMLHQRVEWSDYQRQ